MPFTDLSVIQRYLIAFSYLDDENKTMLEDLWSKRFFPNKAFLLSCKREEPVEEILDQLTERLQAECIQSLHGEEIIVAFFLDLTKPIETEWAQRMHQIRNMMTSPNYLNATVPTLVQFGYIGKKMQFTAKEQKRASCAAVMKSNRSQEQWQACRMILVAKPALSKRNIWKESILALDLLRRHNAPADLFAPGSNAAANDDIGFFRYDEFDAESVSAINEKLDACNNLLNNKTASGIKQAVKRRLEELTRDAKEITVDGEFQPLHPELNVPDGGFLCKDKFRKQAKKGEYAPYNAAAKATRWAVGQTAAGIRKMIAEMVRKNQAEPAAELEAILSTAAVGVPARERLKEFASEFYPFTREDMPVDPVLDLSYAPQEELQGRIQNYLKATLEHAIVEERIRFEQALADAVTGITLESVERMRSELIQQRLELENRKTNLVPLKDVIHAAAHLGTLRVSEFPTAGLEEAKSRVYMVLRDRKMQQNIIAQQADQTDCFIIDGTTGGIPKLDNMPLKALQIVMADCSEEDEERLLQVLI